MPIDLAVLGTEVKVAKYAGWDQTAIAADLNDQRIDADRDVPVADARRVALLSGDLARIKLLAEARPATAITPLAMTFAETLSDRDGIVPAGDKAAIDGMLTALVSAGALSTAGKAGLMALFKTKISRAQQLFGEPVQVGHVARAMGG